MKLTNITQCRNCRSESLAWFTQNTVPSGIQQNRLNTRDVQCLFVLGCDECGETLKMISADKVAEALNASHAEGGKV